MSTLDGSPSHTYRHMLTVMQVTQQDLGDYMCVALNVHGKSQQLIQVTGELVSRRTVLGGNVFSR